MSAEEPIMAKKPRIPEEFARGFTMMVEGGDTPAAQIAIPTELTRLAAIPIASEGSFQIDPVVHECIRLFNANYQGCEYCLNARAAVAVQAGLDETLVEKLTRFESSDLPEHIKAALRITNAVASGPTTLTKAIWENALRFFTEQEVVDIVLLSVHTTSSKVTITLGLDPGKENSSRVFFPSEAVYGSSPALRRAVEEMERNGLAVRESPEIAYEVKTKDSRAK
jgi:AhpD family alkylhydroperoxidase